MVAWNFVILVEDSDTGGRSLVAVRMEYLLAYQFWYWQLRVENLWGGARGGGDGGERGYFVILLIFSCGSDFNVGRWGLVRLVLYTSLRLQSLCTYSLPTPRSLSYSWRACIIIPHKNSVIPFRQRKFAFSSSNLFRQKSVFTLNYKFLQTLIHDEKTRDPIINVHMVFHSRVSAKILT